MLRLVFAKLEGGSLALGVFSELRFDRNLVRPSMQGRPIAEHREHAWFVEGGRYLRLDCEGTLMLYFADAKGTQGPTFGPYTHVSSVDGVLFADRKKFATLNETKGLWTIEPSGLQCPMLVAQSVVP